MPRDAYRNNDNSKVWYGQRLGMSCSEDVREGLTDNGNDYIGS